MTDHPTPPPPARRKRLRNLVRYGAIALLVVAAGLFLARRQIGGLLARTLDERLSAAGIHVEWRAAVWVPGPGVRLHGLALFRDAAKHERIALFDKVTAIKGEAGWDRWDAISVKLDDARLVLGQGDHEATLEHMNMDLRIQVGNADLRELRANLQGLRIEAKGGFAPATAAKPARVDIAKESEKGRSLFEDVNLDWLKPAKEWVRFQPGNDGPVLKIEFQSRQDGGMDLAATLDGRKFQWHGQTWDLVDAAVKTSIRDEPSPVEIERVRIGFGGRTAELAGSFDAARGGLKISRFESGIDALALARALAPDAAGSLAAVTATGAWRVSGAGELPLDHPEKGRWNGSVALDGDLAYAAGETRVALRSPAMTLRMDEQVVSVSGFKAGLWDGNLEAPETRIHLPSAEAKPRFETQATLKGARLQSLRKSFGAAGNQPGTVEIGWKGGGGFELASITGSGALGIRDAEFYRIPLLGPLHVVFDKLTPGFARDVASTLSANHRIGGGILHIDNLKLESKLTRIEANGSVDLNRQYARLTAKAKLQGIAGLATAILSALLEVEGEGPVSDVQWKLKNVPGIDMIGEAAGVVGKTGGAVIDGAGSAVKGAGKAAKGLLKIPGKLLPGRQ